MKRNSKYLLVLLVLSLFLSCAQVPQQLVSEKPVAPVVDLTSEKIRDSIVWIESETASGTGFFVAPDKIATNTHVVAHAGHVFVKSLDREKDWTVEGVVGFDAKNSLVILKLTDEGKPLPLGNSDTLEIGESISIFYYRDGEYKITDGSIQSIRKRSRWLRLNTTTSKVPNGSPVLDNNGQVIGVVVPYGDYAVSSSVLEALLAESVPIEPLVEWQQREQVRAAAYYGLGKEKSKVEDYADAIVNFDKAIELDPTYLRAYYGRGKAQSDLGDHDSAIASYTQVLEMDPAETDAYYGRGSVRARRGDYTEAIIDLDKAIEFDAQYADAYSNRGGAKFLLGVSEGANGNAEKARSLYEAALVDCDKAIEIDPEFANTYNFRGATKISLDDFEGAILDFSKAIAIDPEDADYYNNRGSAKSEFGESENARGNTKEAQRSYQSAIADYTQAIKINPKDADVYENRATVRCKLGDIVFARGDVEKGQRFYHEGVTDYDKYIQLNNSEDVDPKAADSEFQKVGDSTVLVIGWVEASSSFYSGSGFFVDRDRIATNIHVVARPGAIFVKRRDKAEICAVEGVYAFDAENDLVILQVADEGIPLSVGDSETIQDDEPVVVVGYPHKKYRVIEGTMRISPHRSEWFRMNPRIGSGGSGSPMLNRSDGHVVGIHAAGDKHYGYAIPSNALRALLAQPNLMQPLLEWQKRDLVRSYAYYIQGDSNRDDEHYEAALVDYNRSIEMNPQLFYGYYQRGRVHAKLGNYKSAIADYDKAIEIKDGIFNIYFNRGLAYIRLGDYESAIADYDKAVAFHPRHADTYKKRAHAKFKLGESKAAQRDITGTLQLYQSAMEDCTQAIWLTPKDADAYDNRGWAYFHLGKAETDRENMEKAADLYEKAIEDYTHAIKMNPEHPHAYRNRANAKSRLGKLRSGNH